MKRSLQFSLGRTVTESAHFNSLYTVLKYELSPADRMFHLAIQRHSCKRCVLGLRLVMLRDPLLVGIEDDEISGGAGGERAVGQGGAVRRI